MQLFTRHKSHKRKFYHVWRWVNNTLMLNNLAIIRISSFRIGCPESKTDSYFLAKNWQIRLLCEICTYVCTCLVTPIASANTYFLHRWLFVPKRYDSCSTCWKTWNMSHGLLIVCRKKCLFVGKNAQDTYNTYAETVSVSLLQFWIHFSKVKKE